MDVLKNRMTAYYSILKTKVDFVNEVKKEYSKTLAADFNSLDFWYVGENKVSEILCFLLNPNASHGQGDTFLKLFINKFEINFTYNNISEVLAIVEKVTSNNRRIDIFLMNTISGTTIGIENKIYVETKDQKNQINDYLSFLHNISRNNSFSFFYLAPKDKMVSSQSFDKKNAEQLYCKHKIAFINYEEDIIPLVHQFAISAENDRVRAFIFDFKRKLESLYMGNSNVSDTEVIKSFMLENASNLNLSFQIFNNIKVIKSDLLKKFEKQLIEVGDELDITFDTKKHRFYLDILGDNLIGISFEEGGVLYGIVRKSDTKDKREFPQIESLFKNNIIRSYWWPIHFWMFQNIENSFEFWEAIHNGSAKDTIKTFIETLIENQIDIDIRSEGEKQIESAH